MTIGQAILLGIWLITMIIVLMALISATFEGLFK